MLPTHVDRKTFLQNLRRSGLVTPHQFRRILARLPDTERGRAVAKTLVEAGVITKFQAELLLVGRTSGFFLGPYKIVDLLGQGGMGRVYKAVHQAMNRTVALKVLAPHLMKTEKAQRLFRREVQAAAQLNHPNIVTAYDANEVKDRHYLAMEFVNGPNLDQLVRKKGPLKVGIACEIMRQAAMGLQCAADHGMVHRDIKPANLILHRARNTQAFVVKILDFGLARLHEPVAETNATIITREHTVMGTPDYLSPEQARSLHDVDIRTDIYSLGCTFYYVLTGQVPYPGGTTLEKLIRHGSETPKAISEFRDDVPDAILEVLARMMVKNADERFQTPAEVAAALAPFCENAPTPWESGNHSTGTASDSSTSSPSLSKTTNPDLAGTLPADMSVTPMSASGEGMMPWVQMTKELRRFSRKALWLIVGILAGLLSGLILALMLLH